MLGAVTVVDGIGFVHARHDTFDPRWAVYFEGSLSSGDPGLQADFAEAADMIGMQMRDQDAVDLVERHVPKQQIARAVDADIHEIKVLSGGDQRARSGTRRIGKRRASADEQHRQIIGPSKLDTSTGKDVVHSPAEEPSVDADRLQRRGANDDQKQQDSDDVPCRALHRLLSPFCFIRQSSASSSSCPKNGSPSNAIVGTPQWPQARCALWFSWMISSYLSGARVIVRSSSARSTPARSAAFARYRLHANY